MGEFLQDLRLGARQLLRRPGFAVAAIGSLALGIGITTTLFTVVNAVLLKASPLREPARLVELYSAQKGESMVLTTSYPDYQSLAAEVPAFSAIAANAFVRGVLSTGSKPLLVTGEAVSANYFDVLGVPVAMGRGFRADEGTSPGSAAVAVVSHGLWVRQLGARPDVVGTTLQLSGVTYAIVGVAPNTFPGTMPGIATDFWVPVTMIESLQFTGVQWTGSDTDPGTSRLDRRSTRWLFLKGRLADGQTIAQARAQAEALYARLSQQFAITNEKVVVSLVPATDIRFHPMLDGYVRAASSGLLGAVALVLLIACANVAALLLARGSARRREMAVRAAIGAGRGRLIRQLLSEGVVLAALGGALGILLASWAGQAIGAFATDLLPIRSTFDFSLDGTVLMFAAGVSLATAVLFGLAPAWSASRPDLVPALKDTLEGTGGPRRRITLRDALVVGQLALSLVLLVAGALLARGLVVARGTDLGFDPSRIATLSFNPQMNGYDEDRAMALRAQVLDAVRRVPGVTAASVATRLPLTSDINMDSVVVPGHHSPGDDGTSIDTVYVGADYFAVTGVTLVAGRAFTEQDVASGRSLAIVNETFARTYWPGAAAVGRVIHSGGFDQPAIEIVGVSRDHKVRSAGEGAMPYVHRPITKGRAIDLIVRTAGPAGPFVPALRQAVWALEPDAVFTADGPASDAVDATMAPTRIGATLIGVVGVLALLLAAVGLYGVVAYSVSLRTREVGIRMALGAERSQVLRMVLGQGLRLALVGVGLGVVLAAGVATLLGSMLYGVSAFDPAAYGAAAGLLLIVALTANLVPAVTAARIAPATAIRG